MPSADLTAGDTERIYQGDAGDTIFFSVDGDIRVASNEMFARSGRLISADENGEVTLKRDREEVWIHAVEDVTVEYEMQGFELSLFGREIIRVNGTETVGNVPQTQELRPAEDVAFQDVEKTATVSDGSSETVKIGPPSGEIWEVHTIYFSIPTTGGGSAHSVSVDVDGPLSFFELINVTATDGTNAISYNRGIINETNTSYSDQQPPTDEMQHNIVNGIRLDNNNPMRFVYSNASGSDNSGFPSRDYGVYARRIKQA